MKYTNKVLKHPLFLQMQELIEKSEAGRIYCHHELSHALDVCRVAWIMFLEEHIGKPEDLTGTWMDWKDRIYVAGLLHDIGRGRQYETGQDHAVEGRSIAEAILQDIDYPQEWTCGILDAVSGHGAGRAESQGNEVAFYISRADHCTRTCFACDATNTCKWKEEERNRELAY